MGGWVGELRMDGWMMIIAVFKVLGNVQHMGCLSTYSRKRSVAAEQFLRSTFAFFFFLRQLFLSGDRVGMELTMM